jgi:hypothetical protein
MENSINFSERKLSPEAEIPSRRTLDQVLVEIQEITDNTHWVQTRLAQFKASGYPIEECWVKNGSIATIWYMKGKKVLRIQVTESELHGKYHKANCVVIPASDISFQASDASRVRNLPVMHDAKSDTSIPEAENN